MATGEDNVDFSVYTTSPAAPEGTALTAAINVCRLNRRVLGGCIGFALDREPSGRLDLYAVVPLYAPGPGTMPLDSDRRAGVDIYSIKDCL